MFNIGELAKAVRSKTDIHFGLYHSLFEWFNPKFLQDRDHLFQSQDFVKVSLFECYACYMLVVKLELVT